MELQAEMTTATPAVEDVNEGVIECVEKVLHVDRAVVQVTGQTDLYDLGLDSIIVVELLTEIEQRFNVRMDIEDLSEELFSQVGRLVSLVEQKLGA